MSQTIKSTTTQLIVTPNASQTYQVDNNKFLTIYLVDILSKNTMTDLVISLAQNATCTLNIYALSNGFTKTIKIRIIHASATASHTTAKAFATNHGIVKLDLVNVTDKNSKKVVQNQLVDGILFDNSARIEVTPAMLIDTNIVKAAHAVSIGNINPNQLFYLMSRGLSKTTATMMILNGMFDALHKLDAGQNLYNKVTIALKQMIEKKYENNRK
ncbi:MAG: SufD family Fe-S cluster assembly protein [Mycoplasmataceae bacterium]|jgi:Fe-S cluster assembly protein SufD|nr:SufD family Fe-S cluster assembly protein [Mycoplasmataceae bacterium]